MRINFFLCLVVFFPISLFSDEIQLIADPHFQKGFYVRDRFDRNIYHGPIQFDTTNGTPVWNTVEWNSTSTIINIIPDTLASGFLKYADENKDFRFGPIGGEEYDLYMAINSLAEYDTTYREPGDPWVHLLVEQRLSPPFVFPGQGPGCPFLPFLDSLIFRMEIKLIYNYTYIDSGYNPAYHVNQFNLFFTIQNLNPESPGYGEFMWLGLPMFNDLYPYPNGGIAYEVGALIYDIPFSEFADTTLYTYRWVNIKVDLLPYIFEALDTAWAMGFLPGSQNTGDYKLAGMNIGWESPGLNISTMVLRNMSLIAYTSSVDAREKICLEEPLVYGIKYGVLYIKNITASPLLLSVYDINGRRLIKRWFSDKEVRIPLFLKPGIYFLSINGKKYKLVLTRRR